MELSCAELPLYGQVTIHAKFDKDIYLPEDAEFYFVYGGSLKRYIMFAERVSDSALQSIVPESKHKETLLQLVIKLGLVKLSLFLEAQPGGSLALALSSEEGATPLDLALQHEHSKLVEAFAKVLIPTKLRQWKVQKYPAVQQAL
ncbi:rho guanine nucleotide exchange factor 28-like [Pipra filicauda]|uniref:Rho guanine nucleotide exchange factor 28-like n=1 Tax=Pipra filicauda TaxID=649802 RepID=A0A7R5KV77_9PASS|nr:rho guanine nucleotide exchange factor 28-like [Pipra filicauda]